MLYSKIIQVVTQSTKVTYQQSQFNQPRWSTSSLNWCSQHKDKVSCNYQLYALKASTFRQKKNDNKCPNYPIIVFFTVPTYNASSHAATCNQRSVSFFHVEMHSKKGAKTNKNRKVARNFWSNPDIRSKEEKILLAGLEWEPVVQSLSQTRLVWRW